MPGPAVARTEVVRVPGAELFVRDIGAGPSIVVLHGGPDFDHAYLLPDLDRLADAFRLICYDQRGRGRSLDGVRPEDVSLASESADLDAVRAHFGLAAPALLGHSWGAAIAIEYALAHPDRVSRLILMNAAPASHEDFQLMRRERRRTTPDDIAQLVALSDTERYRSGDLGADADYYRVHFRSSLREPAHLERLLANLRVGATAAGILTAREIEALLMAETWLDPGYSALARLRALRVPALVLHGEHDLVPVACAEHLAEAIPGARLVVFEGAGHFAYLERPEAVRAELGAFFGVDATNA